MEELKIYCKNTNEYIDVQGGDSLQAVFSTMKNRLGINAICAKVNNVTRGLHFRVYRPQHIEFLSPESPEGYRVYINSLCMIMYKAITDLYPGKRLLIRHFISNGYYCEFKHEKEPISAKTITAIKERMQEIVAEGIPFVSQERLTEDVIEMMKDQGMPDKVRLLSSSHKLYCQYYKLGNVIDTYYSPLAPSTASISVFDLLPYNGGMLLMGPNRKNLSEAYKPKKMKKTFKAYTDYVDFNCVVNISDVGELNAAVKGHYAPLLINVTEALHNKMFAKIADDIAARYKKGGARVVLIAGPSSSGKTTSAMRLSIQLITNYIVPKMISLDNYFVNRLDTPRDEFGELDYESLYALDLKQLNEDLQALLDGKEVSMPTYNFTTGKREYKGETMKLNDGDILLMEGIHGLNPDLTPQIPDKQKFKIFVSALTTLNIDDHNWIPASDNRLLRRIVRDSKYRNITAQETIARWASVRRGEEKWIFPYQENADAMFNSSLIFELAVMKDQAERVLKQIPVNAPEYSEAYRLLHFLEHFESLNENEIPSTSLLREFLGGSLFHY